MVNELQIPEKNEIMVPAEQYGITPSVIIDGKPSSIFDVISVEAVTGVFPGRAILRMTPERFATNENLATNEVEGPSTLNVYSEFFSNDIGAGTRVAITHNDIPIFAGTILKRVDSGGIDEVIFEAVDDRQMLKLIPLRGQVVLDPTDKTAKFISARSHTLNPQGFWNCTGYQVDIEGNPFNGQIIPIFSHDAYQGKVYESENDPYVKTEVGVITPWTGKRWLAYCAFVLSLDIADLDGLQTGWRTLASSNKLTVDWTQFTNAQGVSSLLEDQTDPLTRKLPSMTLQGKSMLGAMNDIFTATRTHTLGIKVTKQDSTPGKPSKPAYYDYMSTLVLIPVFVTGANQGAFKDLRWLIGGNATDVPDGNVIYDFQVSDSAEDVRESVLVEGDPILVEGELTSTSFLPAWSDWEEEQFRDTIKGNSETGYARYYNLQGEADPEAPIFLDADGQDGRPLAYRLTRRAVDFARQLYPRVYKAFRIDSSKEEVKNLLDGVGDEYTNENEYPVLQNNRIALPQQLQFLLSNPDGTVDEPSSQTKVRYPIRLQVKDTTATEYTQAGFVSVRVTGDGLIWLDQAEEFDGKPQCIYAGGLYASDATNRPDPDSVALKDIVINLAMPMDHRVTGYEEMSDVLALNEETSNTSVFVNSYADDLGGKTLEYIDSTGYSELHQKNSSPTANTQYIGAESGPLNRYLPGGNEALDATFAAQRKLYESSVTRRQSSWKVNGIRTQYVPGLWIQYIYPVIGDGEGQAEPADVEPYNIQAPISSIVYDFRTQTTIIGGIISEVSNNSPSIPVGVA